MHNCVLIWRLDVSNSNTKWIMLVFSFSYDYECKLKRKTKKHWQKKSTWYFVPNTLGAKTWSKQIKKKYIKKKKRKYSSNAWKETCNIMSWGKKKSYDKNIIIKDYPIQFLSVLPELRGFYSRPASRIMQTEHILFLYLALEPPQQMQAIRQHKIKTTT